MIAGTQTKKLFAEFMNGSSLPPFECEKQTSEKKREEKTRRRKIGTAKTCIRIVLWVTVNACWHTAQHRAKETKQVHKISRYFVVVIIFSRNSIHFRKRLSDGESLSMMIEDREKQQCRVSNIRSAIRNTRESPMLYNYLIPFKML